MLEMHPIIVDADLGIHDGQHRLEAARFLDEYIYYYIKENITPNDTILLNTARSNWKLIDYIYYWSTEDEEYKFMCDIIKKYNSLYNKAAPFVTIFTYFSPAMKHFSDDVKAGRATIQNKKGCEDFFKSTYQRCKEISELIHKNNKKKISSFIFF
jgi:hypothetical protein